MKNYLTFALTVLFVLFTGLSFALDFKPEVIIGGTVFTGFQYNADNADFISKLDSAAGPNSGQAFGYNASKNQFETSKNSFYVEEHIST